MKILYLINSIHTQKSSIYACIPPLANIVFLGAGGFNLEHLALASATKYALANEIDAINYNTTNLQLIDYKQLAKLMLAHDKIITL